MNRLVPLAAAVAALALATAVPAQEYKEGQDYFKLPVPVETRNPDKIEVVEVFSYGCIHCYELEPGLNAWLVAQGDDVDFHRVPMATRNLRTLAQAFFTAQAMDVLPQVHMSLFENIHDYGIDMTRPQLIRRMFVKEAGVDEEEFARIFDSFAINTRVRQADAQTRLYRVQGTPTLIVDGRYLVDTVSAGTARRMLAVVGQLIDVERAARAKAAEDGTGDQSASPPSS
ncbi:MAG: thiol:disulfide interchange protein DsbA/DsbL [Gammaproteobacteria bacterium]|nr:thiol:disulfide interchange protein DsbA/DsbL [Gammaproteobacteria bacterium]